MESTTRRIKGKKKNPRYAKYSGWRYTFFLRSSTHVEAP
jgi:hypothetical protein